IRLPPEERKTPEQTINRMGKKLETAMRANPSRRVRSENIEEHITRRTISKAMAFPIEAVNVRRRADEVFKLVGEVQVVSASRRGQRISEAPSNIVVLTQEMIRRRGYLTMTEALQDVPYFDFTTFHDSGEYPTHFLLRGLTDVGQTKVLTMED